MFTEEYIDMMSNSSEYNKLIDPGFPSQEELDSYYEDHPFQEEESEEMDEEELEELLQDF